MCWPCLLSFVHTRTSANLQWFCCISCPIAGDLSGSRWPKQHNSLFIATKESCHKCIRCKQALIRNEQYLGSTSMPLLSVRSPPSRSRRQKGTHCPWLSKIPREQCLSFAFLAVKLVCSEPCTSGEYFIVLAMSRRVEGATVAMRDEAKKAAEVARRQSAVADATAATAVHSMVVGTVLHQVPFHSCSLE